MLGTNLAEAQVVYTDSKIKGWHAFLVVAVLQVVLMGIGFYYNGIPHYGIEIWVFFVFTVVSFIGGLVASTCFEEKIDWGWFGGAFLLWVIEVMTYLIIVSPNIPF